MFAARCLRDLTTAWRLVNQDPTLEPARARWQLHPDLEPPTGLEALSLLTRTIQPLLTRFHPFVHALYSLEGDEELDEAADALKPARTTRGAILEQARGLGNAQLHEICALELYNHIAGQESYRHCHNETCGRLFVTQWGRAEHGQSRRQGVLYCTPSCAQAQAQRVYRRHKKTRREQNP